MTFEKAVKTLGLKDPCTKDEISPEELTQILKDDVVLAVERPGSWEGSNIIEVLRCHGLMADWC